MRRGLTVVELLVALTLLGVLGALAGRALRQAEGSVRTHGAMDRAARTADEVVSVGEALIGSATTRTPPRVLGDTAVEWWQDIARGLSCAAGGDSVLVPLTDHAVWWSAAPDTTDVLTLETAWGGPSESRLLEVRQRPPSPACPTGAWRVRLPWPSAPSAVVLVHIARRMRLVSYRGSDGLWWWGERRCPASLERPCGPAQPITGPLPRGRSTITLGGAPGLTRVAVHAGPGVRRGVAVVPP
jgi:prepilin-type N-terminal cleavage/methylation domain-containing protein